jgi:hypothetical protein
MFSDELRQFSAAPVPRPPQPTRPILIVVSWPATWTSGASDISEAGEEQPAARAAVAAVPDLTKLRRETGSDMLILL